jgi:hypothetical protein
MVDRARAIRPGSRSIMVTLAPARPGEDGRSQADGTGAHHQHPRALAHAGTADRMSADGEKFHRSGGIQGQPFRRKEISLRQAEPFAHPAVAMDAENRDGHAAVRLPLRQAMQIPQEI